MENLKTSRQDADKALNTYAWIDKNKGVVRIPIGRAMEVTITQLAQQKPAAAGPIATPEVQAASPAPAGSPQPGATQPAASLSPAAQSSPPASASPAPTKTP